jgi:four helix bundle protein
MSTGEFKQFLGHARGSLFEVETQIELSRRLDLLAASEAAKVQDRIDETGKLLGGLLKSLEGARRG